VTANAVLAPAMSMRARFVLAPVRRMRAVGEVEPEERMRAKFNDTRSCMRIAIEIVKPVRYVRKAVRQLEPEKTVRAVSNVEPVKSVRCFSGGG
jgi:hypothetical protein